MSKTSSSLEKYKVKKQIEKLSKIRGYGTELISLYIPQTKKVSDVLNYLKQESSTAVNIKSKSTRKNVLSAIETVIQRLKLIPQATVKEKSMVFFCGAIPQNGQGTEKIEIYPIIPPRPINTFLYRCSAEFILDPLIESLKEEEIYGLLVLDRSEAAFATLDGSHLEIAKRITSGVHGKHSAGGQSARRFERIIEQQVHEFFVRTGEYANKIFLEFLENNSLKGIIIGGPGPSKEKFANGNYLDYRLQDKIIDIIDIGYSGEDGVRMLVKSEKVGNLLANVRYMEEKKLFQEFLKHLAKDTELAVYGEDEVRYYLEQGAVEKIFLSEALDIVRVTVSCPACGYQEEITAKKYKLAEIQSEIQSRNCPKCNSSSLSIQDIKELIEELGDLGEQTGAQVEILSTETEEGQELWQSFGGIAGILRYRIDS